MIKPALICMLSFLVVEINSLGSTERSFPREPFIKQRMPPLCYRSALWRVWVDMATCPQVCPDRKVGEEQGERVWLLCAHPRVLDCSGQRICQWVHVLHSPLICSETLDASLYPRLSDSPSVKWEA